jgi:serine/threonine-protein kinase
LAAQREIDKSKNLSVPRPAAGMSAAPTSARVPVDTSRRVPGMPVGVGEVINGKYLIESFLGEGGVGVVAAALNIELDEPVALKFLRPEMLAQPEIVARFMREAKAACRIKSEYVANVYDVGTQPDGAPFLVMEHLVGEDLGTVVSKRGQLGYREATEYVMQTCEALAVAHAQGVVHRDIKPENLFLTSRAGMSVVKVLDFGISKAALTGSIFGSALPLVKTVNLMGTPLYMSPEQVRSADGGDMRSDIWALGMVLFEILTGTLPFSAPTITELCAAILEAPMASVTSYRTDLPEGYAEVLERCLERDPAKRFQNVAEMAVAFMPFAPKRARICAERAAQALRAAGLVEESSVRFLSTMPPPSSQSSTLPSIPRVGAGVSGSYPSATGSQPSFVSGSIPVMPPTPLLPMLPSANPSLLSQSAQLAVQASDHPPQASRTKLVLAFLAVAAVAAGVGVVATRSTSRSDTTPAVVTRETAPSTVTGVTPQVAAATPATPETAAAGTAPVGQKKAAAATPAAAAPRFQWPPPKAATAGAKPAAPPPTTGAAPKKSSEEPDLGY